tara:strand:- start:177 stop:419 length:243 start_codon:yes stop_codon:yes gene_type:complete
MEKGMKKYGTKKKKKAAKGVKKGDSSKNVDIYENELKIGKVNDSAKGKIEGIDKGSIVEAEDNAMHQHGLSKLANLSLKH